MLRCCRYCLFKKTLSSFSRTHLPSLSTADRHLSSVALCSTRKRLKKYGQLERNFSFSRHLATTQSHSDDEVAKFSKLASEWWDRKGDMQALHSMNELRVPFIRDSLTTYGYGATGTSKPLRGVTILDVGCGAGILSEALSRLGASVVGIDASEEGINAAKAHRSNDPELTDLQYMDSPLEDIVAVGSLKFDCIVASEVVEHVPDLPYFIGLCASVLKPGGSMIVTTINRTLHARWLAIFLAENVFRVAPKGAHDYDKLVTPEELSNALLKNDCHVRKIHGTNYNPFLDKWTWAHHTQINYMLHATKADEPIESENAS